MRYNYWLGMFLLLLQPAIADDGVVIRHSAPMPGDGGLGTKAYTPLEDEAPFIRRVTEKSVDFWAHVKMPKASNVSDEEWRKILKEESARKKNFIPVDAYELSKQSGEYVGWFGIVRSLDYDADADQTRLRVEHKYFDGLTDLHLQVVSLYGAGDFHVLAPGKVTSEQVPALSLVRVYGPVSIDETGLPAVAAQYIRVWDWGLFTFMDYGKDKSAPEWVQLRNVQGGDVYSSRVNQQFYEDRLGPRKAVEP